MRLHTDTLTVSDLIDALNTTGLADRGVMLDWTRDPIERGSRKRARRIDFYLIADPGYGRRWANSGSYGARSDMPYKAPLWHECGAFLAELFHRGPDAVANYYDGARDFECKAVRPWMDPPDEARTIEDWRTMYVQKVAAA